MQAKKQRPNRSVRATAGIGPRLGGPHATNDVPLLVGPRKLTRTARKNPAKKMGKKSKTRK